MARASRARPLLSPASGRASRFGHRRPAGFDLYRLPPTLLQAGWLRERLTGLDAALDLTVGRASLGDLWAEGLYLRASLEQGLLRVPQLNVRDLAEAQLSLAGSGDLPVESFQLAGQAESAVPLASCAP